MNITIRFRFRISLLTRARVSCVLFRQGLLDFIGKIVFCTQHVWMGCYDYGTRGQETVNENGMVIGQPY